MSAIQLRHQNISDVILDIIKETNIAPNQLEIEVTESILIDNFDTAIKFLTRLSCHGVHFSLDDFGTGYSSLTYLKKLPLQAIKIDRSFIIDITSDDYDKKIVNMIIGMAHALELKVVAEGVEEQGQFELLKAMSCDEIQGYLLSKPTDADSLTRFLEDKAICI